MKKNVAKEIELFFEIYNEVECEVEKLKFKYKRKSLEKNVKIALQNEKLNDFYKKAKTFRDGGLGVEKITKAIAYSFYLITEF